MDIEGSNKGTHGLDIPQSAAQTERARLNLVSVASNNRSKTDVRV